MSKQYKLLKWYPSLSPGFQSRLDEGKDVVVYKAEFTGGYYKHGLYEFTPREIEDNPEYWEELKRHKGYEILTFTANNIKHSEPAFIFRVGFTGNDYWKIDSVKRISDNEEFKVGDYIKGSGRSGKIKSIRVESESADKIVFTLNDDGTSRTQIHLKNAEHGKEPLFTTEDGVEIFSGDRYWFMHENNTASIIGHTAFSSEQLTSDARIKRFSTREAAEQYQNPSPDIEQGKEVALIVDHLISDIPRGLEAGYIILDNKSYEPFLSYLAQSNPEVSDMFRKMDQPMYKGYRVVAYPRLETKSIKVI